MFAAPAWLAGGASPAPAGLRHSRVQRLLSCGRGGGTGMKGWGGATGCLLPALPGRAEKSLGRWEKGVCAQQAEQPPSPFLPFRRLGQGRLQPGRQRIAQLARKNRGGPQRHPPRLPTCALPGQGQQDPRPPTFPTRSAASSPLVRQLTLGWTKGHEVGGQVAAARLCTGPCAGGQPWLPSGPSPRFGGWGSPGSGRRQPKSLAAAAPTGCFSALGPLCCSLTPFLVPQVARW